MDDCEEEELQDIFTVSSCPVENLSITDKVHALAEKDKQVGIKFIDAKWKKITYDGCADEGYNYWGICKWLN